MDIEDAKKLIRMNPGTHQAWRVVFEEYRKKWMRNLVGYQDFPDIARTQGKVQAVDEIERIITARD